MTQTKRVGWVTIGRHMRAIIERRKRKKRPGVDVGDVAIARETAREKGREGDGER